VPHVVSRHTVATDAVAAWREPRVDLVVEHRPVPGPDGTLGFSLERGPFEHWQREVRIAEHAAGATTVEVVESVDYRLAVPIWGPLFGFALRRRLRAGAPPGSRSPWWAPPQVMDARASTVLGLLCLLGAVAGYLGTLITQTVTFAAREFGASTGDQGTLLAAVRVGVLLSLVIAARADRTGRARVLRLAVVAGCAVTALGALAPGMWWLGTTQTFARALSTVAAILIGIIAVEEMPSGSRAYAVSVLAMTAALGAGLCVANVSYADAAEGAWRVAYVVPLLAVPAIWRVARRVPETHRFARQAAGVVDAPQAHDHDRPHAPSSTAAVAAGAATGEAAASTPATPRADPPRHEARRTRLDRGRFALLAASGFAWSIFLAPAAQFLNEYLRTERGFSSFEITLFVLATNTPGGLGIVAGGRLADRRGRRIVGVVGIAGGVGFTVVSYLVWGWPLWATSVLAAIIGALAIPALGVYGPELFPTSQRGLANGGLQVVSVAGSSLGLLVAGWLGDRFDALGPAMAILAVGPLVLIALIVLWYPETARRELEELNPSDATGPST
jgi:MFS family permease